MSGQFGTGAEVSYGHFGTSAEMSWVRSVLGLKCLDTTRLNVIVGINVVLISDKCLFSLLCMFFIRILTVGIAYSLAVGTERTYWQFSESRTQSRPMIYLCSINGEIHMMGAKVRENKSSRKWKFPITVVPRSESSRKRMGQGANWPGSYWVNWPGSEKARYRYLWYLMDTDTGVPSLLPLTCCRRWSLAPPHAHMESKLTIKTRKMTTVVTKFRLSLIDLLSALYGPSAHKVTVQLTHQGTTMATVRSEPSD